MQITEEDIEIRNELQRHTTDELIAFRNKLVKINTPRAWAIRYHILAILMDHYLRGGDISQETRKEFEKLAQVARIDRLRSNDWSFGCDGTHRGIGTEDCPFLPHHHHDVFCASPTIYELQAAGIDSKKFRRTRRD